ncbi:Eco57I restriction-modification methylase domain-containing protein [Pseudoflavonifractor capillosus]|uniref:Eco57I restriction-modification methylase domain-containing protein n=1 Tax=Pseudoflavonifractor capillosus TaxID=106588 RepID=UPI00195B554A|nr:BREX-1 system adenine-specific DNA-methyltransferase PglX [Pseudoflavonifractor capillosus]MBM6897418.1 Eco57I restriction-modification methylase domain-containing protein [Pseudoflavonifractor capillosus]
MNKSAIQKFAMGARTMLMEQVAQRAYQYGITKDGYGDANAVTVNGKALSTQEQSQRRELVREIQAKGYDQVIEEVAYTWFNRFIALRYMEVNNYLPSHIRVFSNAQGAFDPEILKEALHIDLPGLDQSKVAEYIEKNETEALYRYLLLTQCNALNEGLPKMFEKMGGYTELLFPNNILRPDSVLGHMVSDIPEEDWTDQVQIIGWLYQYYNTELKAETFDLLKKNVKVTKERIPSVTQLFTPDWIVRYMVENSLGRLVIDNLNYDIWAESEKANIDLLKSKWKYYVEEAEQAPEVDSELRIFAHNKYAEASKLPFVDTTFLDPCMGSGHVLVYAFDVFMDIYTSQGWNPRDAAQRIVEKNLYGLDIDKRAAQLAYFAVMMKARQYDRRFLTRGIQPNLYSPGSYANGQEYGSLLVVDKLEPKPEAPDELTLFDVDYEEQLNTWNFRRLLSQKYDVVVTNPPYMAVSNGNAALNKYIKDNYPDSKGDLFAAFIERCWKYCSQYLAMITQHSWMFLSSFEKLRTKLLLSADIVNMAHLGARAFEEIGGEVVQTTSFVLRMGYHEGYRGTYCRLVEPTTQQGKEDMFLAGENRYAAKQTNFFKIPGSPIAYWVNNQFLTLYDNSNFTKEFSFKRGIATGDNDRFLRLWFEVCYHKVGFSIAEDTQKWFPYNKGGEYRRWYGNREYLINWECDGEEIRNYEKNGRLASRPQNISYNFSENISYSSLTSGALSFRHYVGFINDQAGNFFIKQGRFSYYYGLALLNSVVASYCIQLKNSTLNTTGEDFASIPICEQKDSIQNVEHIVFENEAISREDWDAYETSWDFKRHPLV